MIIKLSHELFDTVWMWDYSSAVNWEGSQLSPYSKSKSQILFSAFFDPFISNVICKCGITCSENIQGPCGAWDFWEERACRAEAGYTKDSEQHESCLMRAQRKELLLLPTSMNILNQFQLSKFLFFFLSLFIFERERERERGSREGGEREGGRENFKQALHWQWWDFRNHEIKSLTLNWVSHPGAPQIGEFLKNIM